MVSEHASPLATIGGVDAGGQNVHVAALAASLVRRGHEVTVYTRRDALGIPDRVESAEGVIVEHVPAGPPEAIGKDEMLPFMRPFGRHLARVWAADPPDVVHAHFWMSGLAALAGAKGLGLPVLQTFHALGIVKRRHQGAADTSPRQRLRLERAVAHDVTHVIATCTDEVFELVRMGVDRRRISVVPCGVDTGLFRPAGPKAPRGERRRILSVGRLVERKGVDTIVRALVALPDTELVVAGGPPREVVDADPEVRRLRAVAEECGVSDRVAFLGQVSRSQLAPLMRSADVAVCVPWYEPFGMVPLEAMACGLPVVASAVGGLVDSVVDGTTGILVPPRDPATLAEALETVLGDDALRARFGAAGARRVHSRYRWDRIAADTEAVYLRSASATAAVTEGLIQ